jgi:hypothetical protein
LRIDGSYCESVEKLDHEACESLKGTRNSNSRADFNEDSFGGVDVDLEFPGLIDWRIEESKKTLREINKGPRAETAAVKPGE